MSGAEHSPLTNVSIQTFATEADRALHEVRWAGIDKETMARLEANDLVSFKSMNVWNKHSKLLMVHIFEYKSADALKSCTPIWEEIATIVFPGVAVKTVAYQGVVTDIWHADDT